MSTDSQLEELTELRRELESNFARALGVDEEELRAAMPLSAERFSQRVSYARTLRLVREAARAYVPAGARVAVVSKGDEELLKLGGSRRAWHFPQHEDGTYAGHYPATSAAASDHLEHLRRKGARFLLIPSTFRWWLEHYADFARQLEARHKLLHDGPGGLVYELQEPRAEPDYLRKLQRDWHEFGRRDPLWAIMTEREKWTLREFFESGVWEVDRVMSYVESLGLPLARRRALDFGCGVGRLTQALCRHFEECRGVDIAPSMIRLAEKYNRHKRRCRYVLNERDDLRVFADAEFDFIYSALVLQHMRPEVAERYVVELLRVLAPGGLLVFQLPARPEKSQAPGGRQPARPRAPLPPEAFRAQITPAADALTLAPGVQAHVRVRVKNLGRAVWPARGVAEGDDKFRLALGGLWTDAGGIVLLPDDGRAHLSENLRPGQEAEVTIVVHTPAEPGEYLLQLDLVQEGVAWFRQQGSAPARVRVTVKDDGRPRADAREARLSNFDVPEMELYGTSKAEVLRWVKRGGGRVVDVQEDTAAQDWRGFRYCVTRTRSAPTTK